MENWMKEINAAITICDKKGIITYMNDKSIESYKDSGGAALIGKNLQDCHSEKTRMKLEKMLAEPIENLYTTEKNGIKKFVCQLPHIEKGKHNGIIEIVTVIPEKMPHFNRN
jgi:transcriptional regulator with PAS, ATPase and Fis domain